MTHRFSVFLLAALLAVPAAAQVQGIGYRLTPAVSYVDFEGDAALTDGLLYGGGVGLSFGEFFELGGSYQLGRDFETDFSGFSGLEDDPALAAALAGLPPRPVDLERYGGSLRINLARTGLAPFITGGTGLLRFDPQDRDASRAIYLKGGAGLQLTGADRYALAVSAEVLSYRYNPGPTFFSPADLAVVGLGYGDFNQTTVYNRLVRGTLQVYLGGRRPGGDTEVDRELRRQFSGGLAGLSLVVEPFYGRVEFDEAFDYRDQAFAGVEAGVDLGPLVGLRGFFGRGVDDGDPTQTQDVQMYGGDVRLRLSEGGSFVPFLTVGGGFYDVLDGYATEEAAEPSNVTSEDRPFAVGGAGVELALNPRLKAVGEARAMLMSTQETGDVSQPENVFLSPIFRGGLSFALGGSAGERVAVVRQSELDAERARLTAEREALRLEALDRIAVLEGELAAARAAGDTDAVVELAAERDAALTTAIGADTAPDSAAATPVAATPAAATPAAAAPASMVSDRFVTLPVPEQGELYVRYGPPGGVSIGNGGLPDGYVYDDALPYEDRAAVDAQVQAAGLDEASIRDLIRETLRESLAAQAGAPLTEADVAGIERSIEDRIADRIGGRLTPTDGASDARVRALERRQDELIDEIRALRVELARPDAAPIVIRPDAPAVAAPAPEQPAAPSGAAPIRPAPAAVRYGPSFQLSPSGGLSLGRGPDGVVVGLRADYETGRAFRYVPELLIGVGGRSSIVANADIAFPFRAAGFAEYGAPYVRAGLGLVSYGGSDEIPPTFDQEPDNGATTLALNLGLGADLAVGGGRLFVDLSTGNFGSFNRLTAGYRFPFGRRAY